MHVKQNLSILIFPKNQKLNKRGETTLYVRVTIDGLKDEFSSGIQIFKGDWHAKTKTVDSKAPNSKQINKKLGQIKADLERHFDLIQAKESIALPKAVINAYQTPINGEELREQRKEHLVLSETLDELIDDYIKFCKKYNKAFEYNKIPSPEKQELLAEEKAALKERIEKAAEQGNKIFEDKKREKTFVMLLDEYLLNFLQLAYSGNRSPNTLEKWIGRKKRYIDFLQFQSQTSDVPLSEVNYKFLDKLKTYLMMHYECCNNTATKYAQSIKEIMERAFRNGWIATNVCALFTCSYDETEADWPSMQEMQYLIGYEFERQKYNEIRDIYAASSFIGYSYYDIWAAQPEDIFIWEDGKEWISRDRQKTGVQEAVPLLPIVRKIFEKYKNHPLCIRRHRLLPVPSNVEYNRCLKEMGRITGIKVLTKPRKGTHRARYFFANAVTTKNGVQLKTTGVMLGQKSVNTTEIYVRQDKELISECMNAVEEKLFDESGNLKPAKRPNEKKQETAAGNFTGLRVAYIQR